MTNQLKDIENEGGSDGGARRNSVEVSDTFVRSREVETPMIHVDHMEDKHRLF